MKQHLSDWENEDSIREYLQKLLDQEGFDRSGLIYGMGHAVYSYSDPRAVILKSYAEALSKENGFYKTMFNGTVFYISAKYCLLK